MYSQAMPCKAAVRRGHLSCRMKRSRLDAEMLWTSGAYYAETVFALGFLGGRLGRYPGARILVTVAYIGMLFKH